MCDIYIVCVGALSCVMTQNKTTFGDRSGSPKLEGKQLGLVQRLNPITHHIPSQRNIQGDGIYTMPPGLKKETHRP